MRPSLEADRRTLIRRVTFDLTGLSPITRRGRGVPSPTPHRTPMNGSSSGLLASPRHGERWGRFWLDVARYAEDNPTGEATNKAPRNPHAYRDWVIKSLNDDLPFDEFVRRQLAADLMPGLPRSELAALGFIGLAPVYHKEPKLSAEVISTIVADEWDERVDTITRGFLGLTVACARCHDHKFDPIGTADYYALAGVMASTQLVERPLVPVDPRGGRGPRRAPRRDRRRRTTARLRQGDEDDRGQAGRRTGRSTTADRRPGSPPQGVEGDEAVRRPHGARGPRCRPLGRRQRTPPGRCSTYRPGDFTRPPRLPPGQPFEPRPDRPPRRFPAVLSPGEPRAFREGSGRKELADGIVGDAASLAGRVIVNRVWGWHFGRPLVTTPSNFGKLGEPPSHPAARRPDRPLHRRRLVAEGPASRDRPLEHLPAVEPRGCLRPVDRPGEQVARAGQPPEAGRRRLARRDPPGRPARST